MSINDAAGANRSPVTGQVAALSRDVFAGLITSTISVAYGLSFAALIFAPPLTPWIAYDIAATFLTTAISAAFVAARSCELQGMSLQSYLFFGSANRLYQQVTVGYLPPGRTPGFYCSIFASPPASTPLPYTASPRSSGPPTSSAPGLCW